MAASQPLSWGDDEVEKSLADEIFVAVDLELSFRDHVMHLEESESSSDVSL